MYLIYFLKMYFRISCLERFNLGEVDFFCEGEGWWGLYFVEEWEGGGKGYVLVRYYIRG